jgi:NAD(P)-dependent dehydrogenase (short-subunit alcohol dehydrogenase family)
MSQDTSSPLVFDRPYRALVMGSSGAIGAAFLSRLAKDPLCQHVHSLSRSQGLGFDLQDESSLQAAALGCRSFGPFDLIIDATGALTLEGIGPEKALSSLQQDQMQKVFQINTLGPALLIKHFSPQLASGDAIYAKLSARVGSISDNKKGGWYSYRASKAALNMVLQTAAIELQRKNPRLRVVAMQPGTVKSELSKPFTSGLSTLLEPDESVQGLLKALKHLEPISGAHFVDHQGQPIPW